MGFCGEGIYPRWVAKRPWIFRCNVLKVFYRQVGLLCSPTGINPLATKACHLLLKKGW